MPQRSWFNPHESALFSLHGALEFDGQPIESVCEQLRIALLAPLDDVHLAIGDDGDSQAVRIGDRLHAVRAAGAGRFADDAYLRGRSRTDLGAWPDEAATPGITIVPDERDDGTNVIAVPAGTGFSFHYGPSSFRRHTEEAWRHGLGVVVARDALLGFDVDTPADLSRIAHLPLHAPEARPA